MAELIGISRLITDERRLENAFNEMLQRQQLLARHSHEAVWLLDIKALTCSFVSESTVNVTGFASPEMLGRFLYDFMPPAQYETLLKHFEYDGSSLVFGMAAAEPKTFVIELYKKGAEPMLAEMTLDVIFDGKGVAQEFVASVREVKKAAIPA